MGEVSGPVLARIKQIAVGGMMPTPKLLSAIASPGLEVKKPVPVSDDQALPPCVITTKVSIKARYMKHGRLLSRWMRSQIPIKGYSQKAGRRQ